MEGYLDMSCIDNCEIKEQSLILRDIVNNISKRFGYVDKGCVEIKSRFDFFDVKILSLLTKGYERKSICNELNISESTLRRRINRICNILNAKNELMAIAKVVELGLIDSDGNIL